VVICFYFIVKNGFFDTVPQLAENVIPDERRAAQRDPESRKVISKISGSRLAPRFTGLGRDDEL